MHMPWNRGGLRWYLIAVGLLAHQSTTHSVLCAVPFLVAGVALHLWAKGCLHQNQEVTTSGPYRFVRHPFYLGNLLVDCAIVIMSGWLPLMCLFPLWWIGVYLPTMRREEAVMATRFGKAYRDYMARVPRIIPTARPPLPSKAGFSWRNPNILRTEVPRCLRFLSYPFLFLLSSEIGTRSFTALPRFNPLCFYSLLMILLFYGLASQVRSVAIGADLWQSRWLRKTSVRIGVLTSLLVVGLSSTYLELEPDSLTIPVGLILMGLSLWVRQRKAGAQTLAEAVLLLGACILWEVPWLSVVPLFLCLAPWLATRVSHPLAEVRVGRPAAWGLIPYGRIGFGLVMGICLLGFLAKEVVTDLL